ncbi:MAG TPA: endonuclease/exonuclease/phosphatase family protein [Flavisolibacter sp.]|nr:endonuclease/exonuclease/phosphatase family protein [Flavisolibacter sp.]
MTYNIRHASPPSQPNTINVDTIVGIISKYQPDLVALQEVDVHTKRSGEALDEAKAIGQKTGMYSFFVKAINYQGGEYGIAILSKNPIVDSVGLALPMNEGSGGEPRAIAIATVVLKNGQKLKFACTHLELKAENRMLQVQKIKELFAGEKLPVILSGDFNDTPGSETINFVDGFFQRSCTQDCSYSFPETNPEKLIDFIFFTPKKFSVKSHQVIVETFASDHRPVMAELMYHSK